MDLGAAARRHPYTEANFPDLKIAIAHYWLVTWRGGERAMRSILDLFPKADIYTLFYNPEVCSPYLENHRVFPSPYNISIIKSFSRYPCALKSLRLKGSYDLLIFSESGPAKKGTTKPQKLPHLCYVHTPRRYCWGFTDQYLATLPRWSHGIIRGLFNRLKIWDLSTVDNVDS